jgi:hypothetical protein
MIGSSKNAGLKVLQKFLPLLDNMNIDYGDDKGILDIFIIQDMDELRKKVIIKIRENIASEAEVNNLDVKIALLVKNRISLDEVIHFTTKQMKSIIISSKENLVYNDGSHFNLKGSDKENRDKKLHYEQLFYLLQTNPQYLTNLMYLMNQQSGAAVTRFLEQTVLTLFGYAQNSREEYLILNLIDVNNSRSYIGGDQVRSESSL